MKLAFSNIAWPPELDADVAALLVERGFSGVEIAPTKWRDKPYEAAPADVRAYRDQWADRGLEVVALQALLFGRPDLQLFGDDSSRSALKNYLRRAIDFAALVGARALVFGSPKNRARGAMPPADALTSAADFFRAVAPYAHERGCVLCIEPNPPAYGCDFITTTPEAVALCRAIGTAGVAVNLDGGAMAMNGEDQRAMIATAAPLVGHVHASEPQLAELASPLHEITAAALAASGYAGWVSVEMRATPGDELGAVRRAAAFATRYYERHTGG